MRALIQANPQLANPNLIFPGQSLQLPGGAQPVSAQAAPLQTVETAASTPIPAADGRFTRVQLAQLFHQAGFRSDNLVAMVAIAMRESGGSPSAFNGNRATGDLSYGLLQINMLGRLGEARRSQLGLASNEQLLDPAINARAAYIISSNGTDLSPWGGYKGLSNTFNTDLGAARTAVQQAQAQGLLGQAPPPPATDTAPAAPSTQATAASMPVLRIGARGAAVADLQTRLRDAGFSPGPIDGWFGTQTQAAVRKFQASRGIVVDGWVGPQTWGQLLRTGGGAPPADGRLVLGAKGTEVRELQGLLQTLGYYRGNVGGSFGPQMDAAVRAFQRDHGLAADGWAGPQTMAVLRNAVGSQPGTPPPTGGGPRATAQATTPAPGVEPVIAGPREVRLQAALDYAIYWATQEPTVYAGGASPYRFGGVGNGGKAHQAGQATYLSPKGMVCFDCSGLVVAMYRQAGIDLAATGLYNTREMANRLPAVDKGQLQPGDLLVKSGSHIVIYFGDVTGDGRPDIVEATPYGPNPRDGSSAVAGVRIADAQSFLEDPLYVGRRVPL